MLQSKVVPQHLACDGYAKLASIFEGVVVMKAGIYACPEDLIHKVTRVLEGVGVDAILKRCAVHHDVRLCRTEISRDERGDGPGDAAVRGRIFRMIRRRTQRQPGRV